MCTVSHPSGLLSAGMFRRQGLLRRYCTLSPYTASTPEPEGGARCISSALTKATRSADEQFRDLPEEFQTSEFCRKSLLCEKVQPNRKASIRRKTQVRKTDLRRANTNYRRPEDISGKD